MGDLRKLFGDVLISVFTLYQAVSGGLDWGDAANPLMQLNPSLGLSFCFFICFIVFGMLNIVAAIFVQDAFASGEARLNNQVYEEEARAQRLEELFMERTRRNP